VTERTALYRAFGDGDRPLYIGISKDFGRRWKEHAKKQTWWNEMRRMTVDWCDTWYKAEQAEAIAIFNEQPQHNERGGTRDWQLTPVPGPRAARRHPPWLD
jgi:predicted GIY-YIG superfamily endonuclease